MQALSTAAPTAEELLDKYAETADKAFSSFICQSKSELDKNANYVGEFAYRNGQRTIYRIQEFRSDRKRWKRIDQQWGGIFKPNGLEIVPESKKGYYVELYDGKKRYEHNRGPGFPGYVIISNELVEGATFGTEVAYTVHGAPCLGYLKGDYKRFDQILKEAGPENVSVQQNMEEINGTLHYVIDANTGNGQYRIWLNPEKGYNFTKAELRKKEGDKYNYGPPLRPGNDFLFLMENTEFREIDGVWIPVKASMKYNFKLPNGGSSEEKITYEITSISMNPDHDALGSFSTDDIQSGAQVIGVEPTGNKYLWHNGKPVSKKLYNRLNKKSKK